MRRITKIILFFVFFLVVYIYACLIFTPKSIKDYGGVNYFRGRRYEKELPNTIDVVAIGNSDLYSSLISQKLYGDYGYTVYNCGVSKETLAMGKSFLDGIMKEHDVKLVIIETDFIYETRTDGPVEQSLGGGRFLVSPFVYHAKWKNLKFKDFYTFPKTEADPLKGYVFHNKIAKTKPKNYMVEKPNVSIPKKNKLVLKHLITDLKKQNIEILLYEAPSQSSWNLTKSNQIKTLASEFDLSFIDFNLILNEINFDKASDYRDKGNHLNYYGAFKVSAYLGEFIFKHYNIENNFNKKGFEKWHHDYELYLKIVEEKENKKIN